MAKSKKLNIGIIGAAAAGGLAVGMVANKVLPSTGLPESIQPYLPLALGVFLTMQRNPILQAAGVGMIGSSAPAALSAAGINIGAPQSLLMPGTYVETLELPMPAITGNFPAQNPVSITGNNPATMPVSFT